LVVIYQLRDAGKLALEPGEGAVLELEPRA